MKAFYHDLFSFPLPETHRFPINKYAVLRERIISTGLIRKSDLIIAEAASQEQLNLAHDLEYIKKVFNGKLSTEEIRRIGFPWSPDLVERSRRSVGSTIAACRTAIQEGVAVNLAGGTHHAGKDHGEGFCVFNDTAVAARVIQQEKKATNILIIDCDVHQGNGTASITDGDDSIFTFSIHGEKNFPFRKSKSDLDIGLEDNADDQIYLQQLEYGLYKSFSNFSPDLVIYIAGADPYTNDRLGRLSLTKQGLKERDEIVFKYCSKDHLPVALVMGGGYSPNIEDIVEIHIQSISSALDYAQSYPGASLST